MQVFDENGTEDTSQAGTVRWQHSANGAGSFNGTERVNVTEDDAPYYDAEMTRAAQTQQHPLKMEDYSDTETIPYTVTGRRGSFDTDAGGAVIYTNTRETKDIAVEKELLGSTGAAARFGLPHPTNWTGR